MAASSLSSPGDRGKLLCNNIFTLSEELALTRDIFILNADNQNKLNERLSFGDFEDLVNESMGNLSRRSNLNSLARTQENKKLLKKHKLRHSRVNIVNVGAQKVHKSAYNTAHLHYLKERSGKDNVLLKNWEEQCSFLRTMLETVKQNHLLPPSPILDFEDRDPSPIGSPSSDRGPSPERGPSPSPSRSPSPPRNKKLTSSMVYSESDSEDEYSSKKGRINEKAEEIPVSVDKKTSSKNKNELKSKLDKKKPVREDERGKHQSKRDVEIRRPKEHRRISDPNRFKIPKVGRSNEIPKVGRTNEGPQSMKSILEEGLRKASSIPNHRQSKYQDFRKEQRLKEMRKRDNPIDIKKVTF